MGTHALTRTGIACPPMRAMHSQVTSRYELMRKDAFQTASLNLIRENHIAMALRGGATYHGARPNDRTWNCRNASLFETKGVGSERIANARIKQRNSTEHAAVPCCHTIISASASHAFLIGIPPSPCYSLIMRPDMLHRTDSSHASIHTIPYFISHHPTLQRFI